MIVRTRSGLWIPPRLDPIVVARAFPPVCLDALRSCVRRAVAPCWVQSASSAAVLDAVIGRPGTLLGDLLRIASPHPDDDARLAAVDRTVARISWHPHRPRVRRALALRAAVEERDVESVKRQELRAAVFLVMGEGSHPQIHRFGQRWPTDEHGRRQPVVPERLPLALFWQWFQDEARKAAEASATGQAYPPAASTTEVRSWSPRLVAYEDDDCDADPSSAPDPLDALLDQERRRDIATDWQALLARATPRQRQLLRTLAEADATEPTLADAARQLGLAPSTVRMQWKRLVDRVRSSGL